MKSTTSENRENNKNQNSTKENFDDDDGSCICDKYNERQTCSSPTLVVTLYDRLVRKGVIKRDLEQRVMAEACTPLLQLIRSSTNEETKSYKHNKFFSKFSSLSNKFNQSNFDVNRKIKDELYYNNDKTETNNLESNKVFSPERFYSNTRYAHEKEECANNRTNTNFTNIGTTFSTHDSCTGQENSPLHDIKHKHLCKYSLKEWLSYYKLSGLTNLFESSPRTEATNWFQWSSPPSSSSSPLSVVYPESVNFNSADYDKHGLYLWGEVGIGKTMILDLFDLCELPCTKRRVHLHSFMSELCDRLVRAERELRGEENEECSLHKEQKIKEESLTVMEGRYDDTNNNSNEYATKSQNICESKYRNNEDEDDDKCFTTSGNEYHEHSSPKRRNTLLYTCVCSAIENTKFYFSKLIHYFPGQREHTMWSKLERYVNVRYRRNSKLTPQWRRPMDKVVDDIIRESRVLCFDEFQTFDVAYAALLASFFTSAFAKGLFMVATSNRPPEELCCTSTSFSQFVPLLRTYCRVLECTSHRECDYRYAQATPALCFHEQIFLYPATLQNERKLVAMVERCMRDNEEEPQTHKSETLHNDNQDSRCTTSNFINNDNDNTTIGNNNSNNCQSNLFRCSCEEKICNYSVKQDECNNIKERPNSLSMQINSSSHQFVHGNNKCWLENAELFHHGRRCVVPRSCNGVALFDFCDICTSVRQQLCSIDYQLIAANYHTIILLNVPQVGTLDYNSLHQFIIFIDELYQRNVKLLMTTKVPWKHLMDSDACWKENNNVRESDKYTVNKIGVDEKLLEECERENNSAEGKNFKNFNNESNDWHNDDTCEEESSYNSNNLRNEKLEHSKQYTDGANDNYCGIHVNDGQNTTYEWEEEGKNYNTETERKYPSRSRNNYDGNDSSYKSYYSEGEDDRSSVFANEYTFRNQEELMSIARIRSRLMEMGCVNYLLRDHINFVTHDYTFANLLNMHTVSKQQS